MSPQAGPGPRSEEKGGPRKGLGPRSRHSGRSVTWRSLASCVGSRAAIARSLVAAPRPWLTRLPDVWPPSRAASLPGCLVHRQEEPTAALTRRPREGPAKPSLGSGRRLVLRHCGSLRLGSAHSSFLGRAAQGVASFVRGLGPTHSLLGPFRSVIPEGNYPCAFGRFHFSHWTTVARYPSPTKLWAPGSQWGPGVGEVLKGRERLSICLPVLIWVTPETWGAGEDTQAFHKKFGRALDSHHVFSSRLPCSHHYDHGGLFHVHFGASVAPAAGFPECDMPISSLLSNFFPAAILGTLPLPVSAVAGRVKLASLQGRHFRQVSGDPLAVW